MHGARWQIRLLTACNMGDMQSPAILPTLTKNREPGMSRFNQHHLILAITLGLTTQLTHAGPLREFLQERAAARVESATSAPQLANVAYGPHSKENYDGAWKIGDKAHGNVAQNKVKRWVSRGIIFISVNYPMLPEADPLSQAHAVARALAHAQAHAAEWGGDATRFVLMGHSAGAHLVALINAHPELARAEACQPWLGAVALDSAAMDVTKIMGQSHFRFYDEAFGSNPAYWEKASPARNVSRAAAPMLMVCSSRRSDACEQAGLYAAQARPLGVRTQILAQDRSHAEINEQLGTPGEYTNEVEAFIGSLDPRLRQLLSR